MRFKETPLSFISFQAGKDIDIRIFDNSVVSITTLGLRGKFPFNGKA